MYTDGVVQEPLTCGMRMDRDYRNKHARSMINRFIWTLDRAIKSSKQFHDEGPVRSGLSYSHELPLLPQGDTSTSAVKRGEHAAERLTRTRNFHTSLASEEVIIPFEYVRRDVRREGLLVSGGSKASLGSKIVCAAPWYAAKTQALFVGKQYVSELLWMPARS